MIIKYNVSFIFHALLLNKNKLIIWATRLIINKRKCNSEDIEIPLVIYKCNEIK